MLLAVQLHRFPAHEGKTGQLRWSKASSAVGWEKNHTLKCTVNLPPAVIFGDLYRLFLWNIIFFSFATPKKYFVMQSADSAVREILTDFRPHLDVKTPEISYYALMPSPDRPCALRIFGQVQSVGCFGAF